MPYVDHVDVGSTSYAFVSDTAGAHNSVYRGKNLGSSVTSAQWDAINAGTFDDLYIGDYWTINSVNWRIAAFDYWWGMGNVPCNIHHVVIVPDTNLLSGVDTTTRWLNATSTAVGAYVGTDFYTGNNNNTGKAQCIAMINSAFGSAHILSHKNSLKTAIANDCESSGGWFDSTIELMTEQMVFGYNILGNVINGTNIPAASDIDNTQLPLFALDHSRICDGEDWWLRNVVSSTRFVGVTVAGHVYGYGANSYTLGIRPAFGIRA